MRSRKRYNSFIERGRVKTLTGERWGTKSYSMSGGGDVIFKPIEIASRSKKFNCPTCGAFLIVKRGKYGSFEGCTRYPRCTFTRNIK